MLSRLQQWPPLQKLRTRYDQLGQRDQRALQVLSLALVIALIYLAIWKPIADFRDDARAEMDRANDLVGWIQSQETAARNLATGGDGAQQQLGDGELLRTVTESANRSGMPLQRFEPSGDQAMRIWLDKAPFTDLTQWLAHLQSEYGIRVDQASLDRTDDPGVVSVRLTLQI